MGETILSSQSLIRMTFLPYRRLAEGEAIEVVGSPRSTVRVAKGMAQALEQFDDFAVSSLNLVHPKMTKVVAMDRPLWSGLTRRGPHLWPYPVFNFWRGRESQNIIVMQGPGRDGDVVRDRSTLFFFRSLGLLRQTYNRRAYVNTDETVQTALADYMTAHFLGDPYILLQGGLPIRNIDQRFLYIDGKRRRLNTLLDAEGHGPDTNSLFMSYALSRVREHIGPKQMPLFLKTSMDGLNQYRESFLEFRGPIADAHQAFVYDVEYFLAVLLKSAQEIGLREKVAQAIGEAVDEWGLDAHKIDHLFSSLVASGQDFGNHYGNWGPRLGVWAITGTGLALDAYLLFLIYLAVTDPGF